MLDLNTANFLVDEMDRSLEVARLDALVSQCGYHRENIVATTVKRPMVVAVVHDAELRGWLPTLCQLVIADGSYSAPLANACQLSLDEWRLRAAVLAPQAPGNRTAALLLSNGAPFADRAAQRRDISQLLKFNGRRVYVVRGDPATGKSHLASFVRHVVEGHPGMRHVYLNVAELAVDLVGPRDVMAALALRMALETQDLTTDDLAQEVRLADKLCDWFIGQSQSFPARGVKWVVQIDGLNSPRIGAGAQDLVDRLVVAAARLDLVDTVLVVLALDSAVPSTVEYDVSEARLSHLTPADVRDYIVAFAKIKNVLLTPQALDLLEQQVLEGLVVPYGHDGMGRMRTRLRELPDLLASA